MGEEAEVVRMAWQRRGQVNGLLRTSRVHFCPLACCLATGMQQTYGRETSSVFVQGYFPPTEYPDDTRSPISMRCCHIAPRSILWMVLHANTNQLGIPYYYEFEGRTKNPGDKKQLGETSITNKPIFLTRIIYLIKLGMEALSAKVVCSI